MTERYVHGTGTDNPLVWYKDGAVDAASRRYLFSNWQGSITAITGLEQGTNKTLAVNAYEAYGIPNDTNVGRFQ